MKMRYGKTLISLFLVSIIIVLLILSMNHRHLKYQSGRDTVRSFGDGTYQIFKGNVLMSLDLPEQVIVNRVKKFRELKPRVYIFGDQKYFVLDYQRKTIQIYSDLETMPSEIKKVFKGTRWEKP